MKFKVGDRVAAYLGPHRFTGNIEAIDSRGIIKIEYLESQVHPNQCRLIKKKEPKYYWVDKTDLFETNITPIHKNPEQIVKVKIVKE